MDETISTLDRLLDPIAECLTSEVARRIVDLRADDYTRSRLDDLRAKANDGTITDRERAEYEEIVEDLDLFAILRAKAQEVLAKRAS